MNTYNGWDLYDEIPAGFRLDGSAGSPLHGYSFAIDKSPILGGKRILVRVLPSEQMLFTSEVTVPKTETHANDATVSKTEMRSKQKSSDTIITEDLARSVNELARQSFKMKLLNDILVDLTICEIEGWCKLEYIIEIRKLVNSIGEQTLIEI